MSRSQRLALVAIAVVVAVVAFVIAKPGDDNEDKASTTATRGTTVTKPAAPQVARIVIAGKAPVGGVAKIKVSKGDIVRFQVSSKDTSDEIHVHGYDLHKDMSPGHPASFRFPATMEGVFEAELEGAKVKILSLSVEPR